MEPVSYGYVHRREMTRVAREDCQLMPTCRCGNGSRQSLVNAHNRAPNRPGRHLSRALLGSRAGRDAGGVDACSSSRVVSGWSTVGTANVVIFAWKASSTCWASAGVSLFFYDMEEPEIRIIDVFVCQLRKKLANASSGKSYIETVWGRGYVWRQPMDERQVKVSA